MARASDRLLGGSPAPSGMTQGEYAAHRGVSQAAVSKAASAGRITVGADGRIDPTRADAEWAARTDSAMRPEKATPALMASRSRKMAADAEIAELKAREASGQLIDVDVASRAWYSASRILRERILALPDHAGPALGLTAEQVAGLRGELVRVLTDLADTMPEAAR